MIAKLLRRLLTGEKIEDSRSGPYLYAGGLSADEIEWVRGLMRDYPFAVEVEQLPPDFYDWSRLNLVDYDDTAEDCMGGSYSRKTKKYGVLHRQNSDGNEAFIFFASEAERRQFVTGFRDYVRNQEPFSTIIE